MTNLRSILLVLVSSACAADGNGDTTAADTGSQTTTETPSTSESGNDDAVAEESSEGDASSSTIDPTTATTGVADTGTEESTGEGPTSGPGVLPGEGGLEAFCRRYVECGGTYYADQQECIDASYDYWGDCATRAAALDEFGACMSEIECTDWSPDAYNPASTPCAEQWQGVGDSRPC